MIRYNSALLNSTAKIAVEKYSRWLHWTFVLIWFYQKKIISKNQLEQFFFYSFSILCQFEFHVYIYFSRVVRLCSTIAVEWKKNCYRLNEAIYDTHSTFIKHIRWQNSFFTHLLQYIAAVILFVFVYWRYFKFKFIFTFFCQLVLFLASVWFIVGLALAIEFYLLIDSKDDIWEWGKVIRRIQNIVKLFWIKKIN